MLHAEVLPINVSPELNGSICSTSEPNARDTQWSQTLVRNSTTTVVIGQSLPLSNNKSTTVMIRNDTVGVYNLSHVVLNHPNILDGRSLLYDIPPNAYEGIGKGAGHEVW